MADWTVDKNEVKSTVDGDFILYRNRPLVREDNIICYGNMSDPYIIQMIVITEKEYKGKKVPDQIYVQLLSTDTSKPVNARVVKDIMRSGLSDALDIAVAWLELYLNQ
ncbi:MAG: hypothetical protein E7576_10040 [Ruminococcaceae bacterium]|nr:hypothetical protein [Oscillospiraceae bacterium]